MGGDRSRQVPELATRKLGDWTAITPPNGEPWASFEARVHRAFARIQDGPRPAAIVAHAAVNRVLGKIGQAYGDVLEI